MKIIQKDEAVSPVKRLLAMRNDDAVSPVIGVILMVAIVVILAAVIAAFVFGMVGDTQTAKNVGIIASSNASNFGVFTITGGSDLTSLSNLTYMLNGTGGSVSLVKAGGGGVLTYPIPVGQDAVTVTQVKYAKVTVVGVFTDGSNQILLERQY
jgi:archaeal type IV pilus assembly protein PilA